MRLTKVRNVLENLTSIVPSIITKKIELNLSHSITARGLTKSVAKMWKRL